MHVNERTLERALVGTGFSYEQAVRIEQGHLAASVLGAVRDLRRAGAAALDLAWVACGRLDGFYEFDLKRWDWSAGTLLVQEAGGTTSRRAVHVAGAERDLVVAGSVGVHDGLVALIGG
jgi:myo-inositol-1(or 4)-monophosphatase